MNKNTTAKDDSELIKAATDLCTALKSAPCIEFGDRFPGAFKAFCKLTDALKAKDNPVPVVKDFNEHKADLDAALHGIQSARRREEWNTLAAFAREAEHLAKIIGLASGIEGVSKGRQS